MINKKITSIIGLFIVVIIFFAFNNSNPDYALITGDVTSTPCTNLGGNGCSNSLEGAIIVNDGDFCKGYNDISYNSCVICREGYEWVAENNNILTGNCKLIQN